MISLRIAVLVGIICFIADSSLAVSDPELSLNGALGLEPAGWADTPSPFVEKANRFELPVEIGGAQRIRFPKTLDARTPIVIHTRHGVVKQTLASPGSYHAQRAGRYLVYKGKSNSILYRYDAARQSLREFVYLKKASDLPASGEVIRWRFEGADLDLRDDGSVVLTRTEDIKTEVRKVSDHNMAERINRFLAKRRGTPLKEGPVTHSLMVIPSPEYIDGNRKTRTAGVRYSIQNNAITLHFKPGDAPMYPLWLDPTFSADADAHVLLNGQSTGDRFGFSVASAGDFNGDGKDDVIVGAIFDDNDGTNSGSAFIFFGGQTGTINNPDANADVVLNDQSGGFFGWSVASAGDFNGDGKDDVIVGAVQDLNNSGVISGSAFIFFGGQTGTINNPDTNADVVLKGQSFADNFGGSVASAGDFNGDGKDDVIVGAIGGDNNGQTNSGSAFIFFGGQTGTINNPDTNADVVLNGQSAGDLFGTSVASAGDFNGDGKDDVIVGAYQYNNSDGIAFIFFGGQTGTINNPDANADVVLNGQSTGNFFGWSVASAGDFNGDGKDDVIAGTRSDNSAFIFFGSAPVSQLTLRADADADVILNGQSTGDRFGASVASAGDFNGDGKDDVIVGANFDDNSADCVDINCDSGTAFIFFGGQTGTINNPDTNADVVLNGQSANDHFGGSVASAGDFNGDGKDDVIVGASLDDNSADCVDINLDSGTAFIFFSRFHKNDLIFQGTLSGKMFCDDGFGTGVKQKFKDNATITVDTARFPVVEATVELDSLACPFKMTGMALIKNKKSGRLQLFGNDGGTKELALSGNIKINKKTQEWKVLKGKFQFQDNGDPVCTLAGKFKAK
jgi:FG-GAP repeat